MITIKPDLKKEYRQEKEPNVLDLIQAIQKNNEEAKEELHKIIARMTKVHIYTLYNKNNRIKNIIEDLTNDIYIIVERNIINKKIKEPQKLLGYIQMIIRNLVRKKNHKTKKEDPLKDDPNPTDKEERKINLQTSTQNDAPYQMEIKKREKVLLIALGLLKHQNNRWYEIMNRILNGKTQKEIMEEMNLDETQFRLGKNKGKTRLTQIIKELMEKN